MASWSAVDQAAYYFETGADALGVFKHFAQSQVFISGISEGAYMAANGAIIHVMVAIYDKMRGPAL